MKTMLNNRVIQLVDKNGNMVNNYQYDKWGNIRTSTIVDVTDYR